MHRQPDETLPLLYGVNAAAVIDVLKARAERWAAGDTSSDGRKIGLIIEGGGHRGVQSGGGAVALGHLALNELFDEVYATSAGAMNAAYFLSHQEELGISIYYENLADRRYFNPFRPWKVIDVDYVFDHVVTVAKPLDIGRILSGRPRFFVAAMDQRDGSGLLIDVKSGRAPVLDCLKAATAIPVFYNRTVEIEGRRCMDGGLPIPFPLAQAIARGCTDILVLLTRPAAYICEKPARWSAFVFDVLCARGNRGLSSAYSGHNVNETYIRELAFGRRQTPPGVSIATICPDVPEVIRRNSFDPVTLRAAAISYGRKTLRIFGADPDAWDLAPIR